MILPLLTIACAWAPVPELKVTVGDEVYSVPALVILTFLIGPLTDASATAPAPPPPTIVISGLDV